MSRLTTNLRVVLCVMCLIASSGCASMCGKGKDPDVNRFGTTSAATDEVAAATRWKRTSRS